MLRVARNNGQAQFDKQKCYIVYHAFRIFD